MTLSINGVIYLDQLRSNAKLLQYVIEKEGQTYDYVTQEGIDSRNYKLSKRNGAGAYELPINEDKVYLNYIPKKVFVSDQNLKDYTDTTFSYFVPPVTVEPERFILAEGQIFRCFDKNSLPQPKENYQYWIIENGKKRLIPNYKTLEVMMAQRGISLLSVRVIPESECEQIEEANDVSGNIPDKSGVWTEDFSDKTNIELLKKLDDNVKSGAAIADAGAAAAQQQIDAVKAQAAADKAAAEQAKAEAVAAKAASDAAIAQAQAAQAAAEAAKAQADAEKTALNKGM
jgi:hypothetical protein